MRKPLKLAVVLGIAALALTACSTSSAKPTTDTMRVSLNGAPTGLDPAKSLGVSDMMLSRMSYDTLVRLDTDGKLIGGLAKSWTATPTSAVFTLRTGAKCEDGTPITPTVVTDSINHLLDPQVAAAARGPLIGPGNDVTITPDDAANTVTVKLRDPWPDLPRRFSVATTGIVCPAGLKDPAALAKGAVPGAASGPYVLKSSQPGVSYSYTLRSDYSDWPSYAKPLPGTTPKTLKFSVGSDSNATANLVLSNALDAGAIQPDSTARFKGRSGYSIETFPFSDVYLMFNERAGSPFANAATRKGVVQAIDQAQFAKVVSNGLGEKSQNLSAKGTQCWAPSSALIGKDDASQALKGVNIRLVGANIVGPNGAGNEYLQESLRAEGANVTLANLDTGGWLSTVFGNPQGWDLTVFADVNTAATLANPLMFFTGEPVEKGGSNIGNVQDTSVSDAFTTARGATDDQARCTAVQASANALIGSAHAAPLTNMPFIYATRAGFDVILPQGSVDDHLFRITK